MELSRHAHRKDEHLSLAEKFYTSQATSQFDQLRFVHQSFPEMGVADTDLTTTLGPLTLPVPLLIEAMTGGSPRTGQVNAQLGRLAARTKMAVASGSQSIALKDDRAIATFTPLRENNPDGLVFANLGAGHTVAQAQRVVDMLAADALELHVNTAQELIMPEGDRAFHWLDGIGETVAALNVPVIVKEVGFGMARETLTRLAAVGVHYVDLGGRGGTNFATIENFRRPQKDLDYLANWGQSTVESLLEAQAVPDLTTIATGGIRNPLDIAKALALGATVVGSAGQVLHHLLKTDEDATAKFLLNWQDGLRRIMTLLGARTVADLRQQPLLFSPELENYRRQRQLNNER
ncbi:type 2 isopentenyl-diphosphate Delta-isomerase [Levilactobacillus suantsaii]|uniref:type 2 isopentenyl-diphosphate Delta-isomerase n=1 Tax=Levilactobacillus suantsaii TaxID=2292255 RepID=UPI0015F461C0|nr:type 2 isopentenyl-diphosphate Delta-isomerase [Levilactobacillus suantsaii]QMU07726.1 type 2 isopentenyl-diphosphate Delta-isomerase [Levilactobacillus suantsaii]